MLKTKDLYDLDHTLAGGYLAGFEYPWQALKGIKDMILSLSADLDEAYTEIAPQVWVHKSAKIAPTAYIGGPCIIGPETEVRHCAFIRGSALVGGNCVVGNSVELKSFFLIMCRCRILTMLATASWATAPIWVPVPSHPMSSPTSSWSW